MRGVWLARNRFARRNFQLDDFCRSAALYPQLRAILPVVATERFDTKLMRAGIL